MVHTGSHLLLHKITKEFINLIWNNFISGIFKLDLIVIITHMICWLLFIGIRHAGKGKLPEMISSGVELFLLLIILLTFICHLFRSNKINTIFKSRWQTYCKVRTQLRSQHLA